MYGRNFAIFLAVCLVALLLCSANAAEERKSTRIVNGQVIHVAQAPYIVQLRHIYGGPFCGGTLVTSQHVVTAAHCFDSISAEQVVVVGGANTRTDPGVQRRIVAIIKPTLYTKERMNGDVAILKLESPMEGPYITPVPLCSSPLQAGSLIQISGWGHTTSGGKGSQDLRTIRIPTNDRQQCQRRWGSFPITQYMFCAHSESQDSCQGDSGGPAIFNRELCGIVSFGSGCAAGVPGAYSDVYALRTFIQDAIKSM